MIVSKSKKLTCCECFRRWNFASSGVRRVNFEDSGTEVCVRQLSGVQRGLTFTTGGSSLSEWLNFSLKANLAFLILTISTLLAKLLQLSVINLLVLFL